MSISSAQALFRWDHIVEHTYIANYIIIVWLLLFWIFRSKSYAQSPLMLEREKRFDYSKFTPILIVIMTILPMVLWAAFRDDIQDTFNYRSSYWERPASKEYVLSVLKSDSHDKGFVLLSILIKAIFGNSEYYFFGICAFITLILISYVYRRLSCEYSFSMLLFFISCDYYSWVLNGMRQGLAVAMIFYASLMLMDKKYFRFILFVFLAFNFHSSSIVFLIAILVINQKPWSSRLILISLAFVVVLFLLTRRISFINNLFADTHYSYAVTEIDKDSGVSAIRALVYAIPTILAFFYRRQIEESDNRIIQASVNLSFIGVLFYVLGVFTSGVFIGRFPIYFSLWNYILLAWEINYLLKSKKNIVKAITVVSYLAYNYYQTWTNMQVYR